MKTETQEAEDAEWERRAEALRASGVVVRPRGAWKEIVGWEKDHELFREAIRLGAEWRERMNKEGR